VRLSFWCLGKINHRHKLTKVCILIALIDRLIR
jgi:hypothetical protein